MMIFDRKLLMARKSHIQKNFAKYDFLFAEASNLLKERLDDFNRDYEFCLNYGYSLEHNKIKKLIRADIFYHENIDLVFDLEILPFQVEIFDLFTSILAFQNINDVQDVLLQIKNSLKNQGMVLISFLGGATLKELRYCLTQAEVALNKPVSPHISPFIDLKDSARLLQNCGFAMPVSDLDHIEVTYPDITTLMKDLKYMGENNILYKRSKKPLDKNIIKLAEEIYRKNFVDSDNNLIASFDIITITGWKK